MRVCLIGHFESSVDEGVRLVGKCLTSELDKTGLVVKTARINSPFFWDEIRRFHPDIIHFVLSPSLSGLVVAKLVSMMNYRAKSIISAIHLDPIPRVFLRLFRPDLTLVQSRESEAACSAAGIATEFLPNGVDIERFRPVSTNEKNRLRDALNVPQDKFVILHLASLTTERNLGIFVQLQEDSSNQVIIVGREHEAVDDNAIDKLEASGCVVWIRHFPNIEQLYALADCYVFPVLESGGCIETPLSVLEAMSCNLPVVATRYGALPRLFTDENGFLFANNFQETSRCIQRIKSGGLSIKTRATVSQYSWENTAKRLKQIYKHLSRETLYTNVIES